MADVTGMASIDGELMNATEATIPVTDEGLVRGDGVFEVVRLYDGVPFAIDEHYARLENSAANLRLPIDVEVVRTEVTKFLAHHGNDPDNQALRIMLTRGGRRILLTEPLYEYPVSAKLKTVEYQPTLVLDGVKSLSYGANRLASRLAQEQGYDEALLVTPAGVVLEAPTSTLFYVKDGRLRTPPLSDHILASITRQIVLDAVGAEEVTTTLDDLFDADEAFLASTMREVATVGQIDEHIYQAPGPVSEHAAKLVADHMSVLLSQA